eukprot:g7660.t1
MYMLQGEGSYEDVKGPKGTLKKGDVQWIMSGSGIEHIEGTDHPGGTLHAFQLWLNCKASKKMADPSYQDVPGEDIPFVHIKKGLDVKILAGLCHKTTGVIQTQVPLQYLDFRVMDTVEYTHIAPVEMTTGIVYVYHGSGLFGAQDIAAKEGDTILLGKGDSLRFKCQNGGLPLTQKRIYQEDLRFIFLAGAPLNEPICRHGTMVLNTAEEMALAIKEYQQNKFLKTDPLVLRKIKRV